MKEWAIRFKNEFHNLLPMMLAHHPPCAPYADHTLQIGSVKFCIGCFIGYPFAIACLLLGRWWIVQAQFSSWFLLILGILLFQAQWLSLSLWVQKKGIKIIQKAIIGIGGGFIAAAIYSLLPFSFQLRIYLTLLIIGVVGIPLGLLHWRNMKKICNGCPQKWKVQECPTDFCCADSPYKSIH